MVKAKKLLWFIFVCVSSAAILSSCGWFQKPRCNVTFLKDGGVYFAVDVKKGDVSVFPGDPVKEGYAFGGWYYSDSPDVEFTRSAKVTRDITAFAKFSPKPQTLAVIASDPALGGYRVETGAGEFTDGDAVAGIGVFTDEKARVLAEPKENGAFSGWYKGSVFLSAEESYSFIMPPNALTLTARFSDNGGAGAAINPSAGFSGGEGTAASPYLIASAAELALVNSVNSENSGGILHFRLTADIDLRGADWTPIGSADSAFTGVFDGNGRTVSNFAAPASFSGAEFGLFGRARNARIFGLNVEDARVNVESSGIAYVGALVGVAEDTEIYSCSASGRIAATKTDANGGDAEGARSALYVGGIIGAVFSTGNDYALFKSLTNGRSSVIISARTDGADIYAGGIAGNVSNFHIEKAFSLGCVSAFSDSGAAYAGGIAAYYNGVLGGGNRAVLTDVFAAADVFADSTEASAYAGRITASFDDMPEYSQSAYFYGASLIAVGKRGGINDFGKRAGALEFLSSATFFNGKLHLQPEFWYFPPNMNFPANGETPILI
ncbi:MAG: InlB B-repeat-containing protein [Clostridiales bacterium]|jgi:uncharacterized repeat protein (TIGR02543 family)|nr:InlB B-repeat-containing protein [Clostridiales bacterium]